MIEYDRFRDSLLRLEEQIAHYRGLGPSAHRLTREGIGESVIRRFETCYDCLWKILKRHLAEVLGVPHPPRSPNPILRLAHENDLFEAPIEQWMRYSRARIDTTHDYDGEKARAALSIIPDFLDDAAGLYETMTGKPWEPDAR